MVLAALLYTVLFIVLLAPHPSLWRSEYIGSFNDVYQNAWNLWWFQRAIAEGQSPYYTPLLYAPKGISLITHPLQPTQGALSLLLSPLFTLHEQYNLLLFFSFIASGVITYDIARQCRLSSTFSLLAGYLVTFSQFHVLHGSGHLELMSMHWLLLPICLGLRAYRRRSSRLAVFSAVSLIPLAFSSLYYLFFFGLVVGQLILLVSFKRSWDGVLVLTPITLSLIALSLLLGIPILMESFADPFLKSHFPRMGSLDTATLFVPGQMSYWADATRWYWEDNGRYPDDHSVSFGVSSFACAYVFVRERLWRRFPEIGQAAALSLPFLFISFGPVVTFFYEEIPVPSLYQLLNTLFPFSSISGLPDRFIVIVAISLPLLVSAVLQVLSTDRRLRFFGAALAAMLFLENLPRRFDTRSAAPAPYAEWLSTRDGIVLDLVGKPGDSMQQQTHHRKPLALGYTAREPRSAALQKEASLDTFKKGGMRELCERHEVRFVVQPVQEARLEDEVYRDPDVTIIDACRFSLGPNS